MHILTSTLFLSLGLIASPSHAITISQNDLPGAITGCANCITDTTSSVDLGYMSVFDLFRVDNGSFTRSQLIRYNLTAASGTTTHSYYDFGNGPTTTHDAYTGYIWLEAPQLIQGTNALFNVYTDQISPLAEPYQYDLNNTWTFAMNLQTAIAGSASAYNSGWPDYIDYGNMQIVDGMLLCIECGVNVTLNLVGLGYTQQGISYINPNDSRALLLSYDDFWDFRQTSRDFYVQAVPVPAAIWLLASGLMALCGLAKKHPPHIQ